MTDQIYRVQISGPGFAVSYDAGIEAEGEQELCDSDAANAISGAIEMASYNLSRVMVILAEIVQSLSLYHKTYHIAMINEAESEFVNAVTRVVGAWNEHDDSKGEQ